MGIISDAIDALEDWCCDLFKDGKTKASERTFPLIPHIEEMLRERKILEEHYSKLLGKDFDREYDGFVCRDNFGKLITPNFVTDHFKRVIKRNTPVQACCLRKARR